MECYKFKQMFMKFMLFKYLSKKNKKNIIKLPIVIKYKFIIKIFKPKRKLYHIIVN